jgi:hypothetical protein
MNHRGAKVTAKKKKGKPSMGRLRLLRFLGLFLLFACIVIVILAMLGPMIGGTGQIAQTKLDAEYLPTAGYLFNNPQPTPQDFPVSLVVEQDIHGFMIDSENVEVFCLQGFVPDDTQVMIKFNQRNVRGSFGRGSLGFTGFDGRRLSHCIEGAIETGLHLLSVEISSDAWSETYSYAWAVEITNDGYTYFPNYLLRNSDNP